LFVNVKQGLPVDREPLPWDRILQHVRSEHPELYRNWFDTLSLADFNGGVLRVTAREPAQARYLRDQCTAAFTAAAIAVSGYLVVVQFASADDSRDGALATLVPALTRMPLSPDYTFEEFVVGPSNRLAHAACRAICTQPGSLYNPLFIHGASGLGKSHLLQATCDAILRNNPSAEVAYVSCETFVNDFVRAIETGRLAPFRASARQCDLLVIDDVQFLAGRDQSQEELFHTFNTLYQSRRQIILSADSPPSEIPTLEDRLVSRFTWGLVAQIDPPSRETRQAILAKKARLRGVDVPAPVLDYIAQRVQGNIRTLEGVLTTFITAAQFDNKPLTLETARELIPNYEAPEPRPVEVNAIMDAVAKHYRIRKGDLVGRKRTRSISVPRQVAMYLTRQLTNLSLEEIGVYFGGRDHSTVIHAEQQIEAEKKRDAALAEVITQFTRRLSSGSESVSSGGDV
jgi:chromosomal replication initiator protein